MKNVEWKKESTFYRKQPNPKTTDTKPQVLQAQKAKDEQDHKLKV